MWSKKFLFVFSKLLLSHIDSDVTWQSHADDYLRHQLSRIIDPTTGPDFDLLRKTIHQPLSADTDQKERDGENKRNRSEVNVNRLSGSLYACLCLSVPIYLRVY